MKARNLMITAVLVLAGSVTMESMAQENIKALIMKCENRDVIDMDIVRNKQPMRQNIPQSNIDSLRSQFAIIQQSMQSSPLTIINIKMKYTPALEKELVDAFRKDKEQATREVEQRREGKVTHMLYQFDDSEYSFTIKNDTVTIRATEGLGAGRRTAASTSFAPNELESLGSLRWSTGSLRWSTDSLILVSMDSLKLMPDTPR